MSHDLHVPEVGIEQVDARGVGRPKNEPPCVGAHEEENEQGRDQLGAGQVPQDVENYIDHRDAQQHTVDDDIVVAVILDLDINVDEGGDTGQEKNYPEKVPQDFGSGLAPLASPLGLVSPPGALIFRPPVADGDDPPVDGGPLLVPSQLVPPGQSVLVEVEISRVA